MRFYYSYLTVRFVAVFIPFSAVFLCVSSPALAQGSSAEEAGSVLMTAVHGSWNDDLNNAVPSLLHVRKFEYPGISDGIWLDEILVSREGTFVWELGILERPALYELSAPPWSWMIVVRPQEAAHLELSPGKRARGLFGASGASSWQGHHPSNTLDSLSVQQRDFNAQVSAHVMLQMNGTVGVFSDSLQQESVAAKEAFEVAWERAGCELESDWARDMLWHSKLGWLASVGSSKAALDSVWDMSKMSSNSRSIEQKMHSTGWFSAWRHVHGKWWLDDRLDWNEINAAIFQADRDSLERSMSDVLDGSSMFSLELAWLEMALIQPGALVDRVWESIEMSDFFQRCYKDLENKRLRGRSGWTPDNVSWILPNGDLDSLSGQCMQPWKLFLIVKDGSASAEREREYFNALIEEADARDLCAFVVSVDSDEAGWARTISRRKSIGEQVVWIGNNPRTFEDYGIQSIPAIVAINAQGELSRDFRSLPSLGLARELTKFARKD